ncbi:radical SAM protein [Massilia sp. CCM 8733]|uniref:Radical SAM protein n=1 Tax=Massilia mucilaginosa TaxID=2609282 RepID=A0ABX0NLX8_9BURK|nr:radical SAM protein [Massilia mucilaginosa]NHZ87771.1 radical SAM protein [Massilia mucilaginosa]
MECTSCDTSTVRKDREHTFFMHEMAICGGCTAPIEARVVLRDDGVVRLIHCNQCGPSEQMVSDDAKGWMALFLARGQVDPGKEGDHYFKHTTSTCPGCLALLPADVVIRDGKVYFVKNCEKCGPSEALVSEDAAYYVDAYSYARAGTEPLVFATEVEKGCPTDCGTCGDHEQHTCLPIIEITDYCNLECPVCIVNNTNAYHLSNEAFTRMIDTLVRNEGQVESIALSGGEPTSHPRLMELIAIATREEIGRIVIITNGLRLGRDRAFAEKIKASGAYIALQFDGFTADTHEKIRGRDLCDEKSAALRMLKDLNIPTQLIFVAARGVNEHQIGQVVEMFLSEDHFLSLNFQPVAFTGAGGGQFAHDPMDRLTIPGVIKAIEEQTNGKLKVSDFAPLPCSHPQCVSLSYLLRMNDGSHIPFGRFVDFRTHGTLLRSSATLGASPEIHDAMSDVVHDVFARQDEIERSADILAALRRTIDVMFPNRPVSAKEAIHLGEQQAKSIFLHHYMDRHDFDLERLRKCCHHYPQVDGRIMPACGFNMFHRGAAKGPETELAAWGKKPWTTDAPVQIVQFHRTDTRQALTGIGVDETPARAPHSIGLGGGKPVVLK